MKDIHLTKKDFKLEWYSGSGAGGQHRNKHQNCCRITHIDSGICVRGTESKSRVSNQKTAFNCLAKKVIAWIMTNELKEKEINTSVIRNYNESRNEVHDKSSGLKMPYDEIVEIDKYGDEIYSMPHVYVPFDKKSGPKGLLSSALKIGGPSNRKKWNPKESDRIKHFPNKYSKK